MVQKTKTYLLVECVTVWTNLGTGGETKRQLLFLFGSEGWNALISSDESMLSKCDVITYATETVNIQTNVISPKKHFLLFLKYSDRITCSKVIKHLRTIVTFSRGAVSFFEG